MRSGPSVAAGPLYEQVQRKFMDALAKGVYAPGAALPSEKELAAHHGVSIGTLRTAMDALVSEGILVRQQGRGTFVAAHDRDRLRFYFFHVTPHDMEKQGYPDVGFIAFASAKADAEEAKKLQIDLGSPVFRLRNRLSLAGVPVLVDDITLPAAQFAGLTERRICTRSSTLYHLYQSEFGRTVVRSSERLRAASASAEQAALLGVKIGSPLLEIRRVACAYDNTPVEWRVSKVNTARHEYASELGS